MEQQPKLQHDLLNSGFLRYVDHMGDDSAIVQAARVSYGAGTKTKREDRGLIRYLMKHQHSTPFEMVVFKFHVKAPILVHRQWHRHRTACLSGDTMLYFDEPAALKKGGRKRKSESVLSLYRKFNDGALPVFSVKQKDYKIDLFNDDQLYTIAEISKITGFVDSTIRTAIRKGHLKVFRGNGVSGSPRVPDILIIGRDWKTYSSYKHSTVIAVSDRIKNRFLRMCNETTGEIQHTHIKNIWRVGRKQVFKVFDSTGKSIKMTADHRCLTENGWLTLGDAVKLKLHESGLVTWDTNAPKFAINGIPAYQDKEWLLDKKIQGYSVSQMATESGCSYHTIRKYLKKHSIQFTREETSRLSGLTQRGRSRTRGKFRISNEQRLKLRAMNSGNRSNLWRGGVTKDRELIGGWTSRVAKSVHERNSFKCVICNSNSNLEAHHVIPVWKDSTKACDLNNLTTLCKECHSNLHGKNLEEEFIYHYNSGDLSGFFINSGPNTLIDKKKVRNTTKIIRKWSKIVNIEYVGIEEVYDIEVEGPYHNFVADGFIVHNSINEQSGRYSEFLDDFYIPEINSVSEQSTNNKQGRGERLDNDVAKNVVDILTKSNNDSFAVYKELLDMGLARELARSILPVSFYSAMYWMSNLRNIFHFINLRIDSHAQYEIRVYGQAMLDIIRNFVPVAVEAFEDYVLKSITFDADDYAVFKKYNTMSRVSETSKDLGEILIALTSLEEELVAQLDESRKAAAKKTINELKKDQVSLQKFESLIGCTKISIN